MALLASALISAVVAMLWQLAVPSATSAPASSYAWLAMLAFGAACAGAGVAWGHQRSAARLRDARLRQQLATQLVDDWLWETDGQHRLRQWRPPAGAATADWAEARPLGSALWDEFRLGAPQSQALRAQLEAQAPLGPIRVHRQGDRQAWRLRAYPQFDDEGRFTGYVGTARPVGEDEQRAYAQALLARLWPELDWPALALRPDDDGTAGRWQVVAATPDAVRLMKLASPEAGPLPSWADACQRLPAPLAEAAAALEPGQTREAGDWTVSLVALGQGGADGDAAGRLLLLRPRHSAEPVDSAAVEEQASFAYSVSHDLRAPIRVVEGFARILKEDYGRFLDRIGNDHLERVLAAAARMNSMIDALLALSRLQQQPLSRKPVDLSQLATFIIEDLRREHPERTVEVRIEPGMLVQGDPTLMRIALENLLGNAWKYSSQTPLAKIEFRHDTHQGRRVLVVADNGAGFDMRFADRLFGVFQRLHSANDFQGTGVGLASVRRIIRRHGGDIWAEAEVGKGARFYFTLG
jgi:signal transduction histidine kinase